MEVTPICMSFVYSMMSCVVALLAGTCFPVIHFQCQKSINKNMGVKKITTTALYALD